MSTKKRCLIIFSVLLSALIVITAVTLVVPQKVTYADGSEFAASVKIGEGAPINYASIEEAFAAANGADESAKITLFADVKTTGTITVADGKNITLDLNGKMLKYGNGNSGIKINGNFALEDGNKTTTHDYFVDEDNHGIWVFVDEDFDDDTKTLHTLEGGVSCGVEVESGGVFTMKNGSICGNDTQSGLGGGVFVGNGGEFIMENGRISGNYANLGGGGVFVAQNGSFTMKGGTISENYANYNQNGVEIADGGTFEISGAPIITGNKEGSGNERNVYLSNGQTITVIGELKEGAQIGVTLSDDYTGAFTTGYGEKCIDTDDNVINPSKYFVSDNADYVPILDNGEVKMVTGNVTVQIGNNITAYDGILDAWSAADVAGTATVTLFADQTTTGTLTVGTGKNITLDLNGKMLKYNGSSDSVITVNGNFTLKDSNATADVKTTHKYYVSTEEDKKGMWIFVDENFANTENYELKTLYGGVITGGNSNDDGGGVSVDGTFTMESGTIAGNYASCGGGVFANVGEFIMKSGNICGNYAETYGGGVDVDGTFTMEHGTISDNTGRDGGGVYVSGTFEMTGGKICDNRASCGGGVRSSTDFSLSGAVNITGNKNLDDSDDNVYLQNGNIIIVTGKLEDEDGKKAQIGVMLADGAGEIATGFTAANGMSGKNPSDYFIPDDESNDCIYVSHPTNGDVTIGTHSEPDDDNDCTTPVLCANCGYVFVAAQTAVAEVKLNGDTAKFVTVKDAFDYANGANEPTEIQLLADVTTTERLNIYSNITLDLNGHILTGGVDDSVFIAYRGAFTLEDSQPQTVHDGTSICGGIITGGKGNISFGLGSVGGGVFVMGGNFTMNGGTIAGNEAGEGGGVYVWAGTFTVTGGTIRENTATTNGGGVYVENYSTFNVSGNPNITGNQDDEGETDNVYLEGDAVITVTGRLEKSSLNAQIGINNTDKVITENYGNYNSGYRPTSYFISDKEGYIAALDGSEVKIAPIVAAVKYGENGTETYYADFAEAWERASNGLTSSEPYYITLWADIETPELVVDYSDKITLDLNGHILRHKKSTTGSALATLYILGKLTLKDSADFVEHKYYVEENGLWVFDEEKGTKTLYGGVVTGAQGNGVHLETGTFTMQGGTIAGNVCQGGGGGVGTSIFTTKFVMEKGRISGNVADYGGGVYIYASEFKISGAAVIADNMNRNGKQNNVHLRTGTTVTVAGALSEGAEIGVTLDTGYSGAFTTGYGENNTENGAVLPADTFFFADEETLATVLTEGEEEIQLVAAEASVRLGEKRAVRFVHFSEAWTYARNNGREATPATVKMFANVTTDGLTVDALEVITLDLNGCMLKYDNTALGQVIIVYGTFFLMDGNPDSVHKYTVSNGRWVFGTGAREFRGGVVTGGTAQGVYVAGDFTMTGGAICGNSANIFGGGVFVKENATFTMTGGTISGNVAGGDGGGVNITAEGTLKGTFNLSGAPKITDNKLTDGSDNNVYLYGGTVITVTGKLGNEAGEKAEIGLANRNAVVTSGYDNDNTEEPRTYFFSDSPDDAIVLSYGEAAVRPAYASVKIGTAKAVNFDNFFDAWVYAVNNGTSAHAAYLTLLKDVSPDGSFLIDAGVVITLDLNGKRFNVEDIIDQALFTVNGEFTLKDVAVDGAIFGSSSDDGGCVYVAEGGVFKMQGGTIYGFQANRGGGVYVDGTFEMTGGAVTGNVAHEEGGGVFLSPLGTFKISGAPTVTGNLGAYGNDNVFLQDGTKIVIDGALEKNGKKAEIAVTYSDDDAFTTGYGAKNRNQRPYQYFISDNPDFAPVQVSVSANQNEVKFGAVVISAVETGGTEIGFADPIDAFYYASSASNATLITLLVDVETTGILLAYNVQGITLDLNGKMLKYTGTDGGCVIRAEGPFVLKDSHPDSVGHKYYVDREKHGLWVFDEEKGTETLQGGVICGGGDAWSEGGGVDVYWEGEFTMLGGAICGNTAMYGGGVLARGSSFVMENGKICGNVASYAGGGVYVEWGLFEMKGGEISENVAYTEDDGWVAQGGGVYTYGEVTMKGGTIGKNAADEGGGVYAFGTFTMETGTICENKATKNGGGVYSLSNLNAMSGGTISENSADLGGGVFVQCRQEESDVLEEYIREGVYESLISTFTLSGSAEITENTATEGGGVWVGFRGEIYEYDGVPCVVIIPSLFRMNGGTVSGNKVTGFGGGVFVDGYGGFQISGNSKITGNTGTDGDSNVYLSGGKTVAVTGELTEGAKIGITQVDTDEAFTTGYAEFNTKEPKAYFYADNPKYLVVLDEEAKLAPAVASLKIGEGNAVGYASIDEAFADANAADDIAKIKLLADVTANRALVVESEKNITLDLNGCILRISSLTIEGSFILTDSRPNVEHNYYIDDNYGGVWVFDESGEEINNGGVIAWNNDLYSQTGVVVCGSFEMQSGTIAGFANMLGMAVGITVTDSGYGEAKDGKFIMNGGKIAGNMAYTGGGVSVCSGTFIMNGGEISGNTVIYFEGAEEIMGSVGLGGAVCVGFNMNAGDESYTFRGKFIMTGGKICNNTAGKNGGGVAVYDGTFEISGTPVIKDNYVINEDEEEEFVSNVYGTDLITVTGELEEGAQIGISGDGAVATGYMQADKPSKYFIPDDKTYNCVYVSNTEYGTVSFGNHNYDNAPWVSDGSTHWHECQNGCGDTADSDSHVYSQEVVSDTYRKSAATCTAKAVYYKSCACGHHGTETFESGELVAHDEEILPAVDATCTAKGKTEGKKCKNCGEITLAQAETAMIAHTEEVIPAVDATCTAAGSTAGKKCSVCGTVIVAPTEIAMIAHTEVTDEAVAPTCTADGKTEGKHCSVCNTVLEEQRKVDAIGHDYGEWTVSKDATENAEGEEIRVCTHDATHFEIRSVPKLSPPEPTPAENETPKAGLTAGAKAGISVGVILFVLIATYLAAYFFLYRRGILLKGAVFETVFLPLDAIFGKVEQEKK